MSKNIDIDQYIKDALTLIEVAELAGDEKKALEAETVHCFNEYVNPGFLTYRKTVAETGSEAAVDWRAEGNYVIDLEGNKYIDCLGGYGVLNLGHRNPKVIKAVTDQIKKLPMHSMDFVDPLRAILAKILATITPGDLQYTFFSNSGTESVEAAIKFARMADPTKRTFIATTRAFHGKSLGALSGTAKDVFRQPFGPLDPYFRHLYFGDLEMMRKTFETCQMTGDDVAAVILEPIQGEGGIYVPTKEYLQGVRELCDQYDSLLIFDEVQTGMGRTGKMFASELFDVTPDILCLAKALGGGIMPIGATIMGKELFSPMFDNPSLHSTTFGGNPLACAAAIATIDVLRSEKLPERAAEAGKYFMEKLNEAVKGHDDKVLEVRGCGLMIGVEFQTDDLGYEISKAMFANKILVAGTMINSKTMRIEPPLTIEYEDMDTVARVLKETLETM